MVPVYVEYLACIIQGILPATVPVSFVIHLQGCGEETQGRFAVDGLVLFDPPTVPPPGAEWRDIKIRFDEKLAAWAPGRQQAFTSPETLAAHYREQAPSCTWTPGTIEAMAGAVLRKSGDDWTLRCPGEIEARIYAENPDLPLWPANNDFACPVLIVGADDAATRFDVVEVLTHISAADVKWVPESVVALSSSAL